MSPKVDQEKLIDRIAGFVSNEFKPAMASIEEGSGGLTPLEVLAKRLEMAPVGQKISFSFAVYLVRGHDPNKPQIACKASVTLKASSPAPEYAELPWDAPMEPQE